MRVAWTAGAAADAFKRAADKTFELRRTTAYSADHTKWLATTLAILQEVCGEKSRYYLSFAALTWRQRGSFIVGGPGDPEASWNPQKAVEKRHHQAYLEDLETARGLLQAAAEHLERAGIDAVYEGKDTPPESSMIMKVIGLAGSPLRKVIRSTPKNEKEVQDAFENLLVGAGVRYSKEAHRFEYSSKTYVPDFTFDEIGLAVEIKFCATAGREKECIAEINDDIAAYKTEYENLLFVIYDVGQIRDVDRFAEAFERHEGVIVRVVKQ